MSGDSKRTKQSFTWIGLWVSTITTAGLASMFEAALQWMFIQDGTVGVDVCEGFEHPNPQYTLHFFGEGKWQDLREPAS